MWRRTALDEIERLDPERDHQRIAFLDARIEFPWDTRRALELALLRTFGVAKGSGLLESTGELTERTQKRYDDTALILSEMLEHGYDSERGRAALRQMNRIHHRHAIPNDEYLYTLSAFIFEPIRWIDRFGWRPMLPQERQAAYVYWREVGRRMGIRDIPESYEAFDQFNRAYEQEHFTFAESNRRLALATRQLYLSWFLPRPLWPLAEPVLNATMDDRMLDALGFTRPPGWLRRAVEAALRLRARAMRLLPPPRRPSLRTEQPTRTYPHGYRIEELGPLPQTAPEAAGTAAGQSDTLLPEGSVPG